MGEQKRPGLGPLAKKMAGLRKRAGLTYYELEKRSGINRAKLMRIEQGTIRYPTQRTLNKLADAFGIDRAELQDIAASGHSGPLLSLPAYLERKYGFNATQIAEVERAVREQQDRPKAA